MPFPIHLNRAATLTLIPASLHSFRPRIPISCRTPFRAISDTLPILPDTIPMVPQNCPTSARNTVRQESERCPAKIGMLSDRNWNHCPTAVGIRNLAKTNSLEFISYYLSRYQDESEDGRTVYGAYGPRLFKLRGINQINNIRRLLKKRDSRRAVIQLFDAKDIAKRHKDVPCTCTMQFMVRRRRLHLLTNMRSNDAFIGLPHDIFAFTMLQEIMARSLGLELGTYSSSRRKPPPLQKEQGQCSSVFE